MKYNKVKKVLFYVFITLLALSFLFPIAYMIFSSLKQPEDLYKFMFVIENPTLENYVKAFTEKDYLPYIRNTLVTTVGATLLTVSINTMCGYALAKFSFKGEKIFILLIMSTMMMPLVLIMTPIFVILRNVGLYNTLWALIIPPAATPTGIFIMRQYLLTVPDELLEAARIDGASETHIFLKIIVPLARPAIATLTIFSFMWRWNDYIWPLIAINKPSKYTLQVALGQFAGQYTVDWPGLLALSTLSMLPLLIVFLIFQRQFTQGVAASGLKS